MATNRYTRKRSARKRSFLLLEVLIALFLLTMSSALLLAPHIMLYKAQYNLVERLFVEMKAAEMFTEIKAELYRADDKGVITGLKKQYANNRKRGSGTPFPLFDGTISLPLLYGKSIDYEFNCELFGLFKGDDPKYYKVTARLYFDRPVPFGKQYEFEYNVMIREETS